MNAPPSDLNTGRPRGISANIPQSAIDDMMKEEDNVPNVPSQPEVINRDVIQPKQPPPEEKEEIIENKKAEVVAPVVNLPDEPSADEEDSLELVFRMPLSGERIRRRFLK